MQRLYLLAAIAEIPWFGEDVVEDAQHLAIMWRRYFSYCCAEHLPYVLPIGIEQAPHLLEPLPAPSFSS